MGKRIFTYSMVANIEAETMVPEVQAGLISMLQQEDIEVIGAELTIQSILPSENDGFTHCMVEISQTTTIRAPGVIITGVAGEGWNSVPAGIDQANCNVAVVFPPGFTIPVKEEGYLYLNAYTMGKSAGISTYQVNAIVYYTKRGA